jgi:hypothetical protein
MRHGRTAVAALVLLAAGIALGAAEDSQVVVGFLVAGMSGGIGGGCGGGTGCVTNADCATGLQCLDGVCQ